MSSITLPPPSSFLITEPIKLGSLKPPPSPATARSGSGSVRCCSLNFKRYDVPKLKPFSRSMLDRFIESVPQPLIQRTENELSDYCTTLEGDECYSCWVAMNELMELERIEPESEVKRIIYQVPGVKSLIGHLHNIMPILREKKNAKQSVAAKPWIAEDKIPEPEGPFPVPDGLPKSPEELEEEEKAKMPESDYTRMLRRRGKFPAWYTPRPDHETD